MHHLYNPLFMSSDLQHPAQQDPACVPRGWSAAHFVGASPVDLLIDKIQFGQDLPQRFPGFWAAAGNPIMGLSALGSRGLGLGQVAPVGLEGLVGTLGGLTGGMLTGGMLTGGLTTGLGFPLALSHRLSPYATTGALQHPVLNIIRTLQGPRVSDQLVACAQTGCALPPALVQQLVTMDRQQDWVMALTLEQLVQLMASLILAAHSGMVGGRLF